MGELAGGLCKTFISNRFDHLLKNGTPFANLVFKSTSPAVLGNLQEIPPLLRAKDLLARARVLGALYGAIEGLDQSVMDDTQLLLNRIPIRGGPPLDGQIPVIDVREF